jgi:hypothetical protein
VTFGQCFASSLSHHLGASHALAGAPRAVLLRNVCKHDVIAVFAVASDCLFYNKTLLVEGRQSSMLRQTPVRQQADANVVICLDIDVSSTPEGFPEAGGCLDMSYLLLYLSGPFQRTGDNVRALGLEGRFDSSVGLVVSSFERVLQKATSAKDQTGPAWLPSGSLFLSQRGITTWCADQSLLKRGLYLAR